MVEAKFDPRAWELRRRVERVQYGLKRRRLDAMLVYDRHNTFYLTGFRCSLSFLFITPREAILLVDGRYIEAARDQVRHCEARLFTDQRRAFDAWQREFAPRRMGFEGSTPWDTLERWRETIDAVHWEECGELIRQLRVIKSADEIQKIERSARLNDEVYEKALGSIRKGMTEWDVRNAIRAEADRRGAAGESFDCIVACGAMSSRPHYQPQARPLEAGQLLLIDMGLLVDGYCSDMTRVVALGRPPKPRLVKVYKAVLEAQKAGLEAAGPGVACAEVDRAARDKLKARRLGRYFRHGLGHGVGLQIHEAPTLNARSKEVLRAGMIVTIEPGVYLPSLGGVRIEDLVVITRNGRRILSGASKIFRTIPFDT